VIARIRAELKEAAAQKRPVAASVARHSMGGTKVIREVARRGHFLCCGEDGTIDRAQPLRGRGLVGLARPWQGLRR
jgi:hypothetical protein